MAPSWTLTNWKVTGPHEVTLTNSGGGNVHTLYFNAQRTGFYCDQAGQRGYIQGRGFFTADGAGAPTSPEQAGEPIAMSEDRQPLSDATGNHAQARSPEDNELLQSIYDGIMEKRLRDFQ